MLQNLLEWDFSRKHKNSAVNLVVKSWDSQQSDELNQSVFSYFQFKISINMDSLGPFQNNNVSKLIAAYCILF